MCKKPPEGLVREPPHFVEAISPGGLGVMYRLPILARCPLTNMTRRPVKQMLHAIRDEVSGLND